MNYVYVVMQDGVPLRARGSMESAKEAAARRFADSPHAGAVSEWRTMHNGEALVFTDPATGRVRLARIEVRQLAFRQ